MSDYEVGDTIRIRGTFRDWAEEGQVGVIVDPTEVAVNIYNADRSVLQADLTAINEATGTYYYDWTLPDEPGTFYIEFTGLVAGKVQKTRHKIKTKWDVA